MPPVPAPAPIPGGPPWIGVSLTPGSHGGVGIHEAIDGTPGARAGLRPDDEILAIDGTPVHAPRELIDAVAAKGIGSRVRLHLRRADAELDVALALEPRPDALDLLHRKLVDKPAPAVSLRDSIGSYGATAAELADHVVLLEFGATWCAFCRSTLGRLDALQQRLGPAGLRIVWISSEPFSTIQKLDPGDHLAFSRARDPDDKLAGAFAVQGLPTLVVIDRHGVVRAAEIGAGDTIDGIEATAEHLLLAP
jgi:thiol-disulfide isomerase/thioredoxin